jgi:hypothetical protein
MDEAKSAGAKVIEIHPSNEPAPDPVLRKNICSLKICDKGILLLPRTEPFCTIEIGRRRQL